VFSGARAPGEPPRGRPVPLPQLPDRVGARAGEHWSNLASRAAVAVLIIQLAVAPVTLGLAVAFVLTCRYSRWRPVWLMLPAVIGLGWTATTGVSRAVSSYLLVGTRLGRTLTEPAPVFAHLGQLTLVAAAWRHGLPGQLPVALIVAAAQARIAVGLVAVQRFRPGVMAAARRACTRAALRRGEVASPDGCCVGLNPHSGRRVTITWEEARGGVLITGRDAALVTSTGLDLAIAAIQHRKTVIIVDMTDGAAGNPGSDEALAASVRAACAGRRAPLAILDPDRGRYDPFCCLDPQRAAGLAAAMIDWTGIGQKRRPACEGDLRAAFEVLAAGQPPPAGSPVAILDEVAGLLRPGGLLAERPGGLLGTAPGHEEAATEALAAQISKLCSTALGARLSRPRPGAGQAIDLARAMAARESVLFCLDRNAHGGPAAMVARLVLADLVKVVADRAALKAPADCLAWINGCQAGDLDHLAALLAAGPQAGSVVVVCTEAGAATERLASLVNVVVVRGQPAGDGDMHATSSATADAPAGEFLFSQEESQGPPGMPSSVQRPDGLTIRVRSPRQRVVTGCRAVR
jgi:hypothetical protein